jgi:hypothetical protein
VKVLLQAWMFTTETQRGHGGRLPHFGLTLSLVLVLLSTPAISLAHGGGTPRLTNAEAGPYRLFAWTEPEPWRADEVHLTVVVTLPPPAGSVVDDGVVNNQLDQPVNDAAVGVGFVSVENRDLSFEAVAELQALGNNTSYEVDSALPAAGLWQVEISVDGSDGQGQASFQIDVLPARRFNWPLLAGGGALLVLAVAVVGWTRRK